MAVRKGAINTLESMMAVLILLSFALIAMPKLQETEGSENQLRSSFWHGLEALNKIGILRDYALQDPPNLNGIKSELLSLVTQRADFTVGVAKANITNGTIEFTEANNPGFKGVVEFTVNISSLDSVFATVFFKNENDADFYIGNELIGIRDSSENSAKIDLTDKVVNGTNRFSVVSNDTGSAEYFLTISNLHLLENPPIGETIGVTSYFISGANFSFKPAEVRVYFWRE